jgi:polysaccharide biosynthesis protein PslH
MSPDRKRSLLIVKRRVPFPLDAGTDHVTYGVISALRSAFEISVLSVDQGARCREGARQLIEQGIDVHLLTQEENPAARLTFSGAVYRNTKRLFLGMPNTLQMDRCHALGPALRRLTAQRDFDLVQFEYWNLAGYRSCVRNPAILINHDAWYQTAEEIAAYAPSRWSRLLWRLEARTIRRHEGRSQGLFDWRLFLSEEDRLSIQRLGYPPGRDVILPVPFVFEPEMEAPPPGGTGPLRVVFVGGLTAPFNVDAVDFFARQIWPRVHGQMPEATFAIVGDHPPPQIRALSAVGGVRVEGYVPDLREYLRHTAVAVSPCRIGTGIKVKVAEAMAAGLPVVGTTIGLSGFRKVACLVKMDEPASFADALISLLRDEERRRFLCRACLQHYRRELWIESVAPKVTALYERMASMAQVRTPETSV